MSIERRHQLENMTITEILLRFDLGMFADSELRLVLTVVSKRVSWAINNGYRDRVLTLKSANQPTGSTR